MMQHSGDWACKVTQCPPGDQKVFLILILILKDGVVLLVEDCGVIN